MLFFFFFEFSSRNSMQGLVVGPASRFVFVRDRLSSVSVDSDIPSKGYDVDDHHAIYDKN